MKAYKKHLIIVGSARSGTSWFSELIALQHRYRMLFEPDHEFNTKHGKLICDRFMTSQMNNSAIDGYLKRVFSNRVDCDWIGQISNRKWKRHLWPLIPKKYIIKFVRCNLSAHYMADRFKIPVVFIIRNPYEVLASQRRVKFPWLYDLSWFESQDFLCDLLVKTYGYDLRKQQNLTDLEKLCIRWCIENSVPFLNDGDTAFEVYKYEDFRDDINLFLDFCSRHDLKPLANLDTVFKQPSSKTHPKSEFITGDKKRLDFTTEEYDLINSYLDVFDIQRYQRQTKL